MTKNEHLSHSLVDLDYDIDPRGILVYRNPLENRVQFLLPAQPISDPIIAIGKIGQQNLLPTHFTLKSKDLEHTTIADEFGNPIGHPVPPGISAFLFWGTPQSRQHQLSELAQSHLGREITRKNRMYVTQICDLVEAGWTPYFAPLIDKKYTVRNPLHVILVPDSLRNNSQAIDATEVEKQKVSSVFIEWK